MNINDLHEFKIIKVGRPKYDRVRSISIVKHELVNFGFNYSLVEIKDIFDALVNNSFDETFDRKHKHCFDLIFDNIEYEELIEDISQNDTCFPENYIMPTAY